MPGVKTEPLADTKASQNRFIDVRSQPRSKRFTAGNTLRAIKNIACALGKNYTRPSVQLAAATRLRRRPTPGLERPEERVRILEAQQERNLRTRYGRVSQVVHCELFPNAIENFLVAGSFCRQSSLQRTCTHGETASGISYGGFAAGQRFQKSTPDAFRR